jgi:Major Facilitator Superfamily
LHQPSPALTGLTIFLTFGAGVLVQTTTTSWPARRLLAAGIVPMIAGLCLLVVSAWTPPPSLALFPAGGIVAGTGIGAIIRGSLTVVISTASPDDRAGALATFFTAGYAGVSVPVVGVGIILQHLSPRVTLLIFAVAVGLVILAAAPILIRPQQAAAPRPPGPDQLAGTTETTLADTAQATCMDELCTAHGTPASTPMKAQGRVPVAELSRVLEEDDGLAVRVRAGGQPVPGLWRQIRGGSGHRHIHALGGRTIGRRRLRDLVEDRLQPVGLLGALLALGAQLGSARFHRGTLLGGEAVRLGLGILRRHSRAPFRRHGPARCRPSAARLGPATRRRFSVPDRIGSQPRRLSSHGPREGR